MGIFAVSINRKQCGVYKIENRINGKCYIGSGRIADRFCCHRTGLKKNNHSNKKLQRAWNKYGEYNFEFSVLEYCLPKECIDLEIKWINYYNSFNNGYNLLGPKLSNAGFSGSAYACSPKSEAVRAKISQSLKGKPLTTRHKEKLSEISKSRSVEIGKHFKEFLTGRPKSSEHRAKLAEINRKRMRAPIERAKIAASKKGRKRAPFSEQWRLNLSKARIGKKFPRRTVSNVVPLT